MKHKILLAALATVLWGAAVQADTVGERLAQYSAEGGSGYSAASGQSMWTQEHPDPKGGAPRSCATCHTADLSKTGKHERTGKPIEPMAPSVNPERLTDAKKIEKWFLRNCKWTLGRECTAQEKGDFLTFIKLQ